MDSSSWNIVKLYGVEHSPWVQGVRLALHHHQIQAELTSVPFGMLWIWRNGLVFPVLQLADGSRHVDSFKMYELLDAAGYSVGIERLSKEDRNRAQLELERLFSIYALGRCSEGKKWAFIKGWSEMRELPRSSWGVCCRALLSMYFWVLIVLGRQVQYRKRREPYDLNKIDVFLEHWDDVLRKNDWLTGSDMGFMDFALMGQLQCMTSGLTDELLDLLEQKKHLMKWLKRMNQAFEGYDTLYTKRLFNRKALVPISEAKERAVFWCAWFAWLIFWPFTVAFVFVCLLNRIKNPARSGGVRQKYRGVSKT